MKRMSLILFVLIGLNVQAQKNIEKEVAYKGQPVSVELSFASDIEMNTWNKSFIKIEAIVDTEEKKYAEQYDLQVNSSDSGIKITSNMKDIIKDYHDEFGQRNDLKQEVRYTLFVPEGVALDLSSVTGNVTSESLHGDFKIDLVVGSIDIKKFKGSLNLNSVTGKLNLPVKDSSYSAKTVMGDIHGNDPDAEIKKGFVGQEMIKDLRNSENNLTLSTVTGDIYLN